MEKVTEVIISICFITILISVLILAASFIFTALNSGNTQAGLVTTGSITNETILNTTTLQTLYVGTLASGSCNIQSVTDIHGNTIDPSNYTVNNCQITYHP